MKKLSLIAIILFGLQSKAQITNFPALYQNVSVNDTVGFDQLTIVSGCAGESRCFNGGYSQPNSNSLLLVANGVSLTAVVTKILSPNTPTNIPSWLFCTQTGTQPVVLGSIFVFTNSSPCIQLYSNGPTTTITVKYLLTGTPNLLNQTYECGYKLSGCTLGSSCNTCSYIGLNASTISSQPLCNVGISSNMIEQKNTYSIKLYPNPNENGILKMEGEIKSKILSCEISNITGQVLQKSTIMEFPNTIDVSSFEAGFYVIKLFENNRSIFTQKVLKK